MFLFHQLSHLHMTSPISTLFSVLNQQNIEFYIIFIIYNVGYDIDFAAPFNDLLVTEVGENSATVIWQTGNLIDEIVNGNLI